MIVRILHEGQYEVDPSRLKRLEELDAALESALHGLDEQQFSAALEALLHEVRTNGRLVAADTIVPSDLTVPHDGASREDVEALLNSEPSEDT